MSTKRKPTQLDRIEEAIAKLERRLSTAHNFDKLPDVLSNYKEPVKEEPLKVGDWVVAIGPSGRNTGRQPECLMQVLDLKDYGVSVVFDGGKDGLWFQAKNLRRATPEEISAHLKAEEEAKPIKFGTPVEWTDAGGMKWRGLYMMPDDGDHFLAIEGSTKPVEVKRHEFTVVNPS